MKKWKKVVRSGLKWILEEDHNAVLTLKVASCFLLNTGKVFSLACKKLKPVFLLHKFPPLPKRLESAFRRLFIGGAEEQIIDAQGRIRLSQEHREYAKLDKEIIILGLTNRFEIWNPALLKQSMEEIDFNAMSDELNDSGIDFAL